jgi:hypothetical protein
MVTIVSAEPYGSACLIAFEAAGHIAVLTGEGRPDEYALELDVDDDIPHNGYSCARCGDVVCIPCFDRGHGLGVPVEPCTGD